MAENAALNHEHG